MARGNLSMETLEIRARVTIASTSRSNSNFATRGLVMANADLDRGANEYISQRKSIWPRRILKSLGQ